MHPLNSPPLSAFLLIWDVFECSSPFLDGHKLFQASNECEALSTVSNMFAYEDTPDLVFQNDELHLYNVWNVNVRIEESKFYHISTFYGHLLDL